MQYDEFIHQVQELAGLDRAGAERATRVTLATLGEYLYRTEQADFGAQLPKELSAMLTVREGNERTRRHTELIELEDFYNRVNARAEVGFQQAVQQARAVMVALRAAVGDGAWGKLRAQFPDRYDDLLLPTDLSRQTIPMSPRPTRDNG